MPIFVCFHPWTRKQLLGMVRWLLSDLAHEDIGLNPNGPPLNLNIHSFHIVLNVTCALSRSGSLLSTQWRCRLRQSTCVFFAPIAFAALAASAAPSLSLVWWWNWPDAWLWFTTGVWTTNHDSEGHIEKKIAAAWVESLWVKHVGSS